MLTILGVNFGRDFFLGGGVEILEKSHKICRKNSPSNFAEKRFAIKFSLRNSPAIFLTHAGPK